MGMHNKGMWRRTAKSAEKKRGNERACSEAGKRRVGHRDCSASSFPMSVRAGLRLPNTSSIWKVHYVALGLEPTNRRPCLFAPLSYVPHVAKAPIV
jgi:hypothetical protein